MRIIWGNIWNRRLFLSGTMRQNPDHAWTVIITSDIKCPPLLNSLKMRAKPQQVPSISPESCRVLHFRVIGGALRTSVYEVPDKKQKREGNTGNKIRRQRVLVPIMKGRLLTAHFDTAQPQALVTSTSQSKDLPMLPEAPTACNLFGGLTDEGVEYEVELGADNDEDKHQATFQEDHSETSEQPANITIDERFTGTTSTEEGIEVGLSADDDEDKHKATSRGGHSEASDKPENTTVNGGLTEQGMEREVELGADDDQDRHQAVS
eukprot:Lankesteria_metandrocarpae@DN5275_c0_g1_i1.p1